MLCLVLCGASLPRADDFVHRIQTRFPAVVSIFLNRNEDDTNVVLGKDFTLLSGKPYIEDILCGVRLRITPQSFYQVNRGAAELLYGKAAELAALTGRETLLDLYCGIGSIGLSMVLRPWHPQLPVPGKTPRKTALLTPRSTAVTHPTRRRC